MAASKVRIEQGATLRLVLTYVLFASAWIGLSDQLLVWLFHDPAQIVFFSSLKGWLFVALT